MQRFESDRTYYADIYLSYKSDGEAELLKVLLRAIFVESNTLDTHRYMSIFLFSFSYHCSPATRAISMGRTHLRFSLIIYLVLSCFSTTNTLHSSIQTESVTQRPRPASPSRTALIPWSYSSSVGEETGRDRSAAATDSIASSKAKATRK